MAAARPMIRRGHLLAAVGVAALAGAGLAGAARGEQPAPAQPAPAAAQKQTKAPEGNRHGAAGQPAKPLAAGRDEPAAAKTGAVGEYQPVLHAQGAKIATCMDMIVGQSATVIDTAHTAVSSWSRAAPDQNPFLSIIGLSYAGKTAPNAAAVLFAAPLGAGRCAGGTVQIYPVAQSCSALQARLIKDGHTLATLQAIPVVETAGGVRDVLIPVPGGGCVVVAVGLRE